MRRFWITLALVALLVLTPAAALYSQTVVLVLVHWALHTFTDLRLELNNPKIALYDGLVTAEEVHLIPSGTKGPALLSIVDFSAKTNIREIITGRLQLSWLRAGQLLIYVSENDETSDPQPNQWLQFLGWLPGELRIGQVHLVTASENTWIFPLKDLRGDRRGDDQFHISAKADYEGEPLNINLKVSAPLKQGWIDTVELDSRFYAPNSGSEISLRGEMEATDEAFIYDFSATANYKDIGEFLRGFDNVGNIGGALELSARMQGNMKGFTLSNAALVLNNMPQYGFEAAGELEYTRSGDTRIQLITAGELASLEVLLNWINLDVSSLGRAQASLRLSGSLDEPVIDNFILSTESDEGLAVNIAGSIDPRRNTTTQPHGSDIQVDLHAPSLAVLDQWLGTPTYEPGPWRASWRLRGTRTDIAIDELIIETGNRETIKVRMDGSIGHITNIETQGIAGLRDIQLAVSAFTPDSSALSEFLDMDIPAHHEVNAELNITGSGKELTVDRGKISIASSDLDATVSEIRASLRPDAEQPIANGSAHINVTVSDTSALSQYTTTEIPVLGEITVSADLTQQAALLQLNNLQGTVSGDNFKLDTRGSVTNLADLSGISLYSRLSELDIRHALQARLDNFQYPSALGQLEGSFTLSDSQGKWRVSDLELHSTEPGGPIELSARGDIEDLTGFTTANLKSQFNVRDPLLLEALTGLRMKPSQGSLTVKTNSREIAVSSLAMIGKTQLSGDADIAYSQEKIEKLRVTLNTPHLYLEDLGLQADQDGEEKYNPTDRLETVVPDNRLERILDNSPAFPTDVTVNIEGLTGTNTNLDSLKLQVTGENNRYTLRLFSLVYADALAEIRGIIDLNPQVPVVSLAGEAIALPINKLTDDLGVETDIKGTLTARGGIIASGKTSPELLKTLSGSLAIAMEDTVVEGAAYDVLATDLLAWIYTGASQETSTFIDCTMAKFQINEGVAKTDSLYIETPRMLATGDAMFDLVGQKLDLTITPVSRTRAIQVPSSIRLRGDMSSPRATISPVSAAADASAQALMLIPKLAMRIFGISREASDKGIRPCQANLNN
jgi:uncharacterized protein involved in outer membrane biogenesis